MHASDPPTPPSRFAVDLNDPAEIRYLKAMLSREFAGASLESINEAVEVCRRQAEPFESRKELLECARAHLRKLSS
jgi:hypothetical protein